MDIPQEAVSIQHNTKAAEPIELRKAIYIWSGRGFTHLWDVFI